MGTSAPSTPLPSSGPAISGHVHGGQQAVVGAHVYLFGVRGDQNSVSRSLLGTNGIGDSLNATFSNPAGSGTDALGTYVLTDGNGNFTFNGTSDIAVGLTYACAQNQLVYALAVGGNTGSGTNNPASYLMSDLGPCMGESLSSTLNIDIDEITTVASVYALEGYMTGPLNIGYDNTSLGATGITNASANVNQLVDITLGTALVTTPNSSAMVPTTAITTLADILGACVNSSGATTTGTPCGTLFANATSNGTSTGTKPTETVTAMLNIAQHPAANVAALYALTTANPAFPGGLTSAPNDFTLALAFVGSSSLAQWPGIPAVDADGNVWFAATYGDNPFAPASYTYSKISPLGASLYSQEQGSPFIQVALDPSGNAYLSSTNLGFVLGIGNTGSSLTRYFFNGLTTQDDGHNIALDASANLYVSDATTGNVIEMSTSSNKVLSSTNWTSGGANYSGNQLAALLNNTTLITDNNGAFIDAYQTGSLSQSVDVCGSAFDCSEGSAVDPTALAVDGNAHIWTLNDDSTLSSFDSAHGTVSGSPFSGGGLNTTTKSPHQPYPWLAIDGASNVWVANYTGSISQFGSNGKAITPAYVSATQPGGYFGSAPTCNGQGIAIDGAGDAWVSCDSSTTPYLEYIGVATPVYTPITPGHLGVKP